MSADNESLSRNNDSLSGNNESMSGNNESLWRNNDLFSPDINPMSGDIKSFARSGESIPGNNGRMSRAPIPMFPRRDPMPPRMAATPFRNHAPTLRGANIPDATASKIVGLNVIR